MTEKAVLSSLASVVITLAVSEHLDAQVASARPASVGLTVVVPPRGVSERGGTSGGAVSLIRRTATAVDFETMVGLGHQPASRIEVRLGQSWSAASTRVLIRDERGEYQQLGRDVDVVARDPSAQRAGTTWSPIRFRVESSAPLDSASLVIPVEYRLTVGRGDEFSVWRVSSVLRLGRAADASAGDQR